MSEVTSKTLFNEEDMSLEFLQFDSESSEYQDFNSIDELQTTDSFGTGVLTLGQLQQEVIDEHESHLQKLNRMVELERNRIDEVYKSHEPAVNLHKQLREELAIMKRKVDQAAEIVAKMQALFEC